MQLRNHQMDAVDVNLRQSILTGHKRPILFAPCSFGKTICAAYLSDKALQKGNKTLFIVHRRMLAQQTKEKFDAYGLHCSIIMANYETDFTAPIMVTTHQTYSRRLMLNSPEANKFFHDAKVIFVDECHFGISPSYKKIYEYYNDRVIIGLTGTPARGDQRGLGEVFDDLVQSVGIKELTEKGFLTPLRYFAPTDIDLSGIKITLGDYNKKQLQEKMNTTTLNGDVVSNWLRIAPERQTIVFTTGVKHSINLQREFTRNGISCAHLDANSKDDEREDVMAKFRSGEIQVVTNCQLFTEGLDADFVSCIVLARGTKSLPLYYQMVGRAQRIYDGKKDSIIIDHGSNISRLGLLGDPIEWTLSGKEIAWKKPKKQKKEVKPITCVNCNRVFNPAPKCPDCFTLVESWGKRVETDDSELEEVTKTKRNATPAEKMKWYRMFLYHSRMKGMHDGWAYHKTIEKFGSFVRGARGVQPLEPDIEVARYIKHLSIKWAKSRAKQEERNAA